MEHGDGNRQRRRLQCIDRLRQIVRRNVAAPAHRPQCVGDLGKDERRRDTRRAAVQESRRFLREVLIHQPLHHDASIDDPADHAVLSLSRSARIVSLLSTDERNRRRNAAARAAKSSSVPNRDARRISRCSASADRPLAAALRLSAPTTSRLIFRTVNCDICFAFNTSPSLPSLFYARCAGMAMAWYRHAGVSSPNAA